MSDLTRFGSAFCIAAGIVSSALAADFEVSLFAGGLHRPVALAQAPDGRVFVTEKDGFLRVISSDGVLQKDEFAFVEVIDGGENGLIGLTLHPDFRNNGLLYVFASVSENEQHVIRYRDHDGRGVQRTVVRDGLPTAGTIHAGGGLGFGPDGKLYCSIGDNNSPDEAQLLTSLSGKILRMNADGSVPSDNPFVSPTGARRSVFARGFRNPFRFAFAPDGRMFVTDVGSDLPRRREEINIVRAGDNCGWPGSEGIDPLAPLNGVKNPIIAYQDEGACITAVVYYTGRQFPPEFRGDLFHLEYVLNRLYRVRLDGDKAVSHELVLQLGGGPIDLIQARDGSLLYTDFFAGAVKRIRYVGPEFDDPDPPPPDEPVPPPPPPPVDEPSPPEPGSGGAGNAGGSDGGASGAGGGVVAPSDPPPTDSSGSAGGGSVVSGDTATDQDEDAAPTPLISPPPLCGWGVASAGMLLTLGFVTRRWTRSTAARACRDQSDS